MQDVLYIEQVDQATTLLKPLRLQILKRMASPCTCPELAEASDDTPQKIYYHVKALEKAGLVDKVAERRVRGVMEGIYQAKARAYWLSPELAGRVGGPRKAQDQMSLGFLLTLAEELQRDVGRLGQTAGDERVPSLGLSAQIELRNGEERAAFMQDVQSLFQTLAEKYGRREDDPAGAKRPFRLALACYPEPEKTSKSK